MRQPFMYETPIGWQEGRAGDWLLLVDERWWASMDHEYFTRVFFRMDEELDKKELEPAGG